MKPIEKNIIVTDEQGNKYQATYLKRAKGLVKNGRARYISENKICLSVPPYKFLEGNKMNDITNNTDNMVEISANTQSKYSLDYVLEQIEKISTSSSYLDNAISELRQMETANGVGDIGNQAKALALADVVKYREQTNQKLIDFYIKMVNNLKLKESDYMQQKLKAFDSLLAQLAFVAAESPDTAIEAFTTMRDVFKESFSL